MEDLFNLIFIKHLIWYYILIIEPQYDFYNLLQFI